MSNKQVVVKRISEIKDISTAHGLGAKKILIRGNQTDSSITQIAYTTLVIGDVIEFHAHPTMDEHFIILSGICAIVCDRHEYLLGDGTYLYIPAGIEHRIEVKEPLTLITIGVAIE